MQRPAILTMAVRYLLVFCFLLLVASCARDEWPQSGHALDTVTLAAELAPARKIKAGTIIYQAGTGNVANTTDNRQAGKKGTAATGVGSSATSTHVGTPWWVFALLFGLGLAGGAWLRSRFTVL